VLPARVDVGLDPRRERVQLVVNDAREGEGEQQHGDPDADAGSNDGVLHTMLNARSGGGVTCA